MQNIYLKHHGIKGMKWGVRKEDVLNERTSKSLEKTSKILNESTKFGKGPKSKTIKKDYSKLSEQELRKRVERLNLEEQYARLSGDSKKVRTGGDWVHEILQDSAIVVGMASSAIGIYLALTNKGGK